MVASKLLLAIATIGLALPAWAARAPIVFDFQDGLQGWELTGAATRVQTQVLGGEWAIFLDGLVEGGASLSIGVDNLLTVELVTFDQLSIDGSGSVIPVLRGIDLIENTFFITINIGFPNIQGLPSPGPVIAFIDNITFHPVPESSSWLYLSLGIAGLVMPRGKLASSA